MGTVLIVDDDPFDRDIMESCLRFADKRLMTLAAQNLEEARRCIGSECPDLVLLDIDLAGESGFDLLKLVRAKGGHAGCHYVVFSGSSSINDRTEAFILGASDYLTKPSGIHEYHRLARKLVEDYVSVENFSRKEKTNSGHVVG